MKNTKPNQLMMEMLLPKN